MNNKYYTRTNGTKVLISEMATPHLRNAADKKLKEISDFDYIFYGYDHPRIINLRIEHSQLTEELIKRSTRPTKLVFKELFRCNIAGVQYSDYQLAKLSLKPGAVLKLWWERSNWKDRMAIRVELKGIKLGYIPRVASYAPYNDTLHQLREKGIKIITTLVSYNPTNPTWNMFTIKCEAKVPVEDVQKEKEVEL